MFSVLDRLTDLRVADVMRRDVVKVPSYHTMREAAAILTTHEISGAPVVDDKDHCIGVITAIDFARYEANVAHCGSDSGLREHHLRQAQGDAPYQIQAERPDLVSERMSTAVQSIRADAPLIEAAREMCVAHLHRLIVLDGHGHVEGVLTTLDVVAALVNAVEEQRGPRRVK